MPACFLKCHRSSWYSPFLFLIRQFLCVSWFYICNYYIKHTPANTSCFSSSLNPKINTLFSCCVLLLDRAENQSIRWNSQQPYTVYRQKGIAYPIYGLNRCQMIVLVQGRQLSFLLIYIRICCNQLFLDYRLFSKKLIAINLSQTLIELCRVLWFSLGRYASHHKLSVMYECSENARASVHNRKSHMS